MVYKMTIKESFLFDDEDIKKPKIRKRKTTIKYIYPDRKKTWAIVCDGKVISKHISFIHAQEHITKLFREKRINNNYKIMPFDEVLK